MKQFSHHMFALYYAALPEKLSEGSELTFSDRELLHRMERVLRLKKGDHCIVFNREKHAVLTIIHSDGGKITAQILSVVSNTQYKPHIMFLLPLLKREALADAVYYLVEAGVNEIWLMETEKVQRSWGGEKEAERLMRIASAAAEQSKNFAFPTIKKPLLFNEVCALLPEGNRFYGNPVGTPFSNYTHSDTTAPFILTCGPEGDFTESEKQALVGASFAALYLTPTILRAETAAFCISSLFRTFFYRE